MSLYEVHLAHGNETHEAALDVAGNLCEYRAEADHRTLCFGAFEIANRLVGALRNNPLPRGWTHLKVVEI